jgi:hypothetical protein
MIKRNFPDRPMSWHLPTLKNSQAGMSNAMPSRK